MEGIIGNDHAPRNAREWKAREGLGTWKESENAGRLEQSRETDRTSTLLCVDGQTLSAYCETSHSYASDSRNSSDNDEEKFEGLSLHMSRYPLDHWPE